MNIIRTASWCIVAALLAFSIAAGLNKAAALQEGPPNSQQGIEVLTRGPVHEAFVETVTFDPEPGLIVPTVPPAPIEELPPEQRPEGTNVAWIPNGKPQGDPSRIVRKVFVICQRFRVSIIAADGNGNGAVYNRYLFDEMRKDGRQPRMWGLLYGADTKPPQPHGALTRWMITQVRSKTR
jgi:hypothetical protein